MPRHNTLRCLSAFARRGGPSVPPADKYEEPKKVVVIKKEEEEKKHRE